MSSVAAALPSSTTLAVADAANNAANKPKPCCVCKDEKARRDECMLFTKSSNPEKDCASTITSYKSCMASYGFNLP